MSILVTGAAGFIGFHLSRALLARGEAVVGVDNLNDYYDPDLKRGRLAGLQDQSGFSYKELSIADKEAMLDLAAGEPEVTAIVHLAAQAGVRYSLENPYAYVEANAMGQLVMLEACRRWPRLDHFVYASSSSVYGANTKVPFAVGDPVDQPVSLYAATKRAAELMAATYSHLYAIPMTGLRFFTVYGPWGRPDMAYFGFTKAMLDDKEIKVFNHGDMRRDFTYIDDIVAGLLSAVDRPPAPGVGRPPHRIFNLGNHRTESLLRFIEVLEAACGRKARKVMVEMQPGEVLETYADIEASRRELGFDPKTTIDEGLPKFVQWYREYYGA
jgi:UDP-glucuronate 4-epimerase